MILCPVPLNLAGATNCGLKEDNFLFGSSWFYLHAAAGKSLLPFFFFLHFSLVFIVKGSWKYVSQVLREGVGKMAPDVL